MADIPGLQQSEGIHQTHDTHASSSASSESVSNSILSQAPHQVSPSEIKQLLHSHQFGKNLEQDNQFMNILLALSDPALGNMMTEAIVAIRSLFNISDAQINVHFVSLVMRFVNITNSGQASDTAKQDLNSLLSFIQQSPNSEIREKFSHVSFFPTASTETPVSEGLNLGTEIGLSLQANASEPPTSELIAATALPRSVTTSEDAAFSATLGLHDGEASFDGGRVVVTDRGDVGLNVVSADGKVEAHVAEVLIQGKGNRVGEIITIGNHLPMLIMPAYIAKVITGLPKAIQDKENLYKVAIVTDSVACLEGIQNVQSIYLLNTRKEISVQTFVNIYSDLVNQGYHRILSLHVSPLLGRSYRLAKEAANQLEDVEISVVNTHANGLGLGMIIREVKEAIDHHYSPLEIGQLIKFCVQQLHFWLCPVEFHYERNQVWLDRAVENRVKMKLKMFNYKPIITLTQDQIHLIESFHNVTKSLEKLLQLTDQENQRRRGRLRRIGIEYRGTQSYRLALNLKNKIQVKYPRIPVSIHVAGSATVARFGAEIIGVCVL